MKVLHVGQLIGGLDVYIRNSITYSCDDFDFVVVHGEADKSGPIIKNGKQIKEYEASIYRELNPAKDAKGLVQLLRIVKAEKPDIIHCHSAKAGVLGRIAGHMVGITTLYTPHAFSFLSTPSTFKRNVYLALERMVKFNSCLLACSESERELGMKEVHYKEDNAYAWNNAVPDVSQSAPKSAEAGKMVCYIGRPSYQKNTSFFVDVIKEVHKIHPEVQFKLLGVGYYSPDLKQFEKQISDYGLMDCIELLPWLSHENTMEYVKRSLFYLTVSRYEGLPLAVIEAMSLGKAIVASDVPGNRDCVKDGYNGYLLPLDKEVFAKKINDLIEDEELLSKFSRNSRTLFLEKFLINERIKELECIYRVCKVNGGL